MLLVSLSAFGCGYNDVISKDEDVKGAWAEVQQSYSSGYLVSDVSSTRTSPWWSTTVRAGWDGTAGGIPALDETTLGYNH